MSFGNFLKYLEKNSHRLLAILVAVSFCISLVYSFVHRINPVVDAEAYDAIAVNLLGGCGFKEDCSKSFEFDTAIVRAGPGYEYFLAGIYAVFGHHYEAVWIIHAILRAASVFLIYKIIRHLFSADARSETAAMFGAALFAFSPDLIEIAAMLMTETLYLFLIIVVVYLFLVIITQTKNSWWGALLGVVTALSIFTRPPVVLFVPLILFWCIVKKQYHLMAVFSIFLALALAPWALRNWLLYHQVILTTMVGSFNIWVGNTLLSDGGQISGGFNPVTSYGAEHGYSGLPKAAEQAFSAFLATHPGIFIKLSIIRLIRYFSLIRPMGFWFYQTGVQQLLFVASSGLWIAAMFILGFAGLAGATLKKKGIFYYLILFALTSPLVLLPTVVQSRYRFQVYPFLAIGASYALIAWRAGDIQFKKIFGVTTLFFMVISGIDLALSSGTVISHLKLIFGV